MNKIYKVIWSKVRCAWVVVSEIARNHGAKGRSVHEGRKRASLLAGALLLGLLTGNGTVWAAVGEKVQYDSVTIGDYPNKQGDLFVYGTSKFFGTLLFNDGEFAYDSQKHGFSFGKAQYDSKLYNYSIAIGDTGEGSDYSIVLGRNASGKGTYDVVIGDGAYAEKANAVAIGKSASAQGNSSIALGESAHATVEDGMAIGHSSESTMAGALAFGKESKAHGTDAVAIGTGAQANNNPYGIAIGKNAIVNNQGSIAIGQDSSSDHPYGIAIGGNNVGEKGANANGTYSIALGADSIVNGAEGGAAIGYGAKVDGANAKDGVALGAYSVSNWATQAGVQGYFPWEGSNTGNIQNSTFQSAISSPIWKSTTAGISIGDTTNGDKAKWITRQLTGLAAGTNDYDAVNVAQLKASMTTLSSADGTVKITPKYNDDGSRTFDLSASSGSGSGSGGHFVSVTKNNTWESDDSLKNAGNYNNDGAKGTQSTAVGVNAQAQTQGTALGNGANASNTGATAIGTGSVANGTSSVALGQDASAQNDNAVAIGHGSGAYANSVAIGGNARSTAERSVHIGAMTDSNIITGSASVSIGADAQATASGAASFGTGAVASGTDALALGQNSSSTGNGSVAIGYQTKVTSNKEHATAVGTSAEANAIEGTVLGYSAKVNGDKGVALGSGAFVAAENGNKTSVALGAGSQVNDGDTVGTASLSIKDTYGETSDSTTYQFAGTNPTGTVSVGSGSGSSEQTRTITHVAAGRVSSTSTDAINGSQLYGVAQSIEKVEQNVAKTATRYYSVNATDTGTSSNYLNDGAHGLNSIAAGNKAQAYGVGSLAIGYSSLAGSAANDATLFSSMAIGPYAKAQGTGAIAFGNSSSSSGYGGVALGGGANVSSYGGVALGGTSSATATGGVALGTGSQANTAAGLAGYLSGSKKAEQADSVWTSTIGAVSVGGGKFKVGSEEKIYTRQITNLAAGTKDTDAVNVAQLKAVEQEGLSLTGNDNQKVTQSLGGNFNITGGLTGDALKDEAASTANLGVRKNANGDGLEVVMTTTPSFDSVTAQNSITIKNASTADGTSDISLNGNGLFMGSKKITGLADGTEKTDAVNFSQLSVVSSELSTFENKAIQVGGNAGGTISRKLGENPILIQGAGTKDNADYSGTNLKTYVDKNGVLQILLDKELLEDRIDVGSALANPTDSRVNYPVVLGTDTNDATIGYVGINGRNGTSAVITSYAGSPIPGSAFNYTDSEGKSRMTRLEYTDQEGHAHHLATLTDGLSFGGDNSQVQIDSDSDTVSGTNVISRKLRATEPGKNATANYLQIKGGADATKLSDRNIGVQASSEDGSLTIKLSQELTGLTSAQFGTTTIDGSGLTLGTTGISLTASGLNNGGKKITNVKAGEISSSSTDAIIGSQLTNILNADGSAKGISFGAESAAGSHTNPTSVAIGGTVTLKGAGGDSSHKNLSTQVTEKGELTVTMAPEIQENKIYVGTQIPKESSPTGNVNYPIILSENTVGTDTYGYVGIKGKNNSQLYLTADQDASGNTRLDYLDTQNNAHLVALTSDGYTFAGDTGTANTLALNSTLSITGGITDTGKLTQGNMGVVSSGNGGLTVELAKSLMGLTDATFNSGAAQTKIDGSGVTAPAYQVGTKTYIDSNGLHANGQKVTNVNAGNLSADSTDAVNGSQLFATNQNVSNNTTNISNLTTRLDGAGMTFAGDSGNAVTKKLNETLTLTGGETSADNLTQLSDKNIGLVADTDGKLEVRLAKDLSGLTRASFTNGKTGGEEQTALVSAGGLSLGEGDAAARFTRSGISAGGQQVAKVGSGLQKVTDTSYLYDDTMAGQENYNHAANIGDVRTMLSDARDVFAGNNGTTATLTLGKTAAFQGADVALTGSQTLDEALAADYSKANLTARTVGNSDGSVTTSLYMKQDIVGRSLSLGNIGTDGTVQEPAAQLYTQPVSDTDSTLTGHLKLTGTKEAKDGQTSSTSADIYVKNALGSDLTDKNRAVTRLMYRDGVDQRNHAVATLDDGFYVQGDANQGNTLNLPLTSTLKIQGNTAAGSSLTAGNIGVVSDGKDTLKVQLADTLTGLKQISFAGSTVSIGQEGINAGGKAISGVLAGTEETDAVNVQQLDEAKAAASAEVKAGKNVTVTKDTTSAKDGHTIYTVAADFKGADVSGSNAVVYDSEAKDKVTLGGSTSATPVKLTNLADGTISSTSTDAVTGRQLNEVITYRNQAINVAGDRGSAVKLNHGNTLTISGDSNISTSSSGSDTAKDGSLQVSLADNVYVKGIHIGSTYPTHSDTSVDSVALTADANNQTGILTLRGDATHVSDTYLRAQADISVLSAAPGQTYMAAPFLQEVYQTDNSGTTTKNQPVRLAYRDNYNTAHQIATLDDGYIFSGDNGDKNLTEKLNGTVSLRGMDNEHAPKITSDTANTYLTKNNIGVVTKPKVLNEDGSTQGGEVEIRLAKDLTGLTSAAFTNDNGDTAVLRSTALTLTPKDTTKKPVALTNQGLDNGNNRITNVAAGTQDTDAVNYGQIKSIINTDGNIKGLTFAAGDNTSATVHLGDTLKIVGATDQDGAQNIHTTVKDGTMTLQLDRKVQVDELHVGQKGSDAASLTAVKLDGETGSIGQLHLQGMGNAQANIMTKMGTASLASTDDTTTRLTYNNGNVGNTHEIAILEDGLRFTGDNYAAASGDKAEQNVLKKQLNQTLSITGGQTDTQQLTALTDKNIGVVAEDGGLSVRLSKVLDGMTDIYMGDSRENASHLTKTGLYLSPKSSTEYLAKFTADDGISAGSQTISDVADGVKDSDAATYGQLKNVEAKANNATKLTVNHGQSEGNLTLTDTPDKDGIHHTYDVALSDKIKLGSGGAGSSITLDGNANTINGGSYVQFGGDGDSKTSPLAIGWQSASLQDVITEEAKGSQTGNYLTGLSNTSWDPVNVGYSPNRAATEGQLRDLEKQVWENPITFLGNHDADKTAEESKGITAQLGSKVRIIGSGTGEAGDFDASNLSVIAGKTSDGKSDALIIQMKKAPSFTTVHAGTPDEQGVYPVSVGQVTVTRDGKTETVDGVVITDGPMITKNGINNYGKQITHLKSGGIYNEEDKKYHYESDEVGTNAATIQDVKNIAQAAAQSEAEAKRVTVSGVNDNITVTPGADNPNHYQVKLSDTLKLGQDAKSNPNILIDGQNGKVTVGSGSTGNNSVIIDGNGGTVTIGNGTSGHQKLTIDGNNGTLSGLTNTTITAPDFATKGRAATEEQLKQVADNVSEIKKNNSDFQLVGEKDQEGNYTGDYKVSDDNQVKLHVQDKMHPDQVKDITIDNVAKASDLGDVSKISEDIQNKENNNVVDALNNLNQKVKDAANGSWESQINGETVKKVKAGDVQNFTSGDNIELSNDNGAIKISTKKDVSFDKVTIGSGDSKMTLDKDGLQAGKVKVSSEGINAGGNRIQGVADGKEKDDAATVGQLQKIAGSAGQAINELGNHLNRMDTRINRVGAGAAALAALHPVETDGRWSLSAGFGSYRNANSLAFGTFYRASDNVLFNMGATVGNGENMINAGFSIALDRNPAVTGMTKAAMVREIRNLKQDNQAKDAQVKELQNQVDALKKENDDTKAKLALIMAKLGM